MECIIDKSISRHKLWEPISLVLFLFFQFTWIFPQTYLLIPLMIEFLLNIEYIGNGEGAWSNSWTRLKLRHPYAFEIRIRNLSFHKRLKPLFPQFDLWLLAGSEPTYRCYIFKEIFLPTHFYISLLWRHYFSRNSNFNADFKWYIWTS
jgi:hypothetical protein